MADQITNRAVIYRQALSDANLLRHAATLLHGKPVFGPADPIRVRNTPTPVPRRVGPADIAQVVATTTRLGRLARDLLKLFQLGAAAANSALARFKLEYDCAYALALLGAAGEAIAAVRRADDSYRMASDEPPPWEHFGNAISHMEGGTYFALGRFDGAVRALSAATKGAAHAVGCTVNNSGLLAAAQLRSGELRSGLHTAQQVITLAKGLRSASVRNDLAQLQEAATARRDSACQDLAREVAILRSAA